MATVGSDGRYCFWDKDSRSKLKNSEAMQLPITKCHINPGGQVFAYAVGYDWSRVCLDCFNIFSNFTVYFSRVMKVIQLMEAKSIYMVVPKK